MNIYEFSAHCYQCGQDVTYFTYLVFHEYDLDVEFPLDMNLVRRIYAEMEIHKDDPYFDEDSLALNYPIKVLGDDPALDDMVLRSGKFPNIRLTSSRNHPAPYAANHCPHCKAFLGNYHLREQVTDGYLRPNRPMHKYLEL